MRSVALLILTLIAGCGPDHGHTAFRCNTQHGCPGGQHCLDGRCRRGDPTGDGVVCGGTTCDPGLQCCVDLINLPRCLPAGDLCPGLTVLCDSKEDCQAEDRCCSDGDTLFCDATCEHVACRDGGDCPSTEPNCCGATAATPGQCARIGCAGELVSGRRPVR